MRCLYNNQDIYIYFFYVFPKRRYGINTTRYVIAQKSVVFMA